MTIIGLTDLHGHVEVIERLGPALAEADVVVLAGDLTNFGRRGDAADVVNAVRPHARRVLAVPGNCDFHAVSQYLDAEGLSLDRKGVVIDDVAFLGVGGSLPCPGTTPNEITEDEFEWALRAAVPTVRGGLPVVLVVHEPPRNTAVDRVTSGEHVGSHSVRAFIEQRRPLVCIAGHIHEGAGEDTLAGCRIINPGPAHRGHYARIVITRHKGGATVDACEILTG